MREAKPKHINVTITPGTIAAVVLTGLLLALVFYLRHLVFLVLTAVVIASAIEPGVNYFMRWGLPRVVGVLIIYLGLGLSLFCLFYFFLPPLLHETVGFLNTIPQYLDSFKFEPFGPKGLGAGGSSISLRDALDNITGIFQSTSEGLTSTLNIFFGSLFSFALIVVLSFYFAVRDTGIDDFLRLVTPVRHQTYIIHLWRRSQMKIGRWMQGQIVLSVLIGILVYLGLVILGVQYAIILGILTAILELIPVFGSIMAAIPAVAVSFIDGGTSLALFTIGWYIIVNQFESNLIYPLVVQKVVGVPPLLVIIALLAGGQLAGFLGIILSVPTAAVIQELVSDIQRSRAARLKETGDNA